MAKILVENMEFYSYHGCFKEEAIIGTHFLVNLEVETDTLQAQLTDRLEETVNYVSLYQTVKEEMDRRSNLIESVAHRILVAIRERFPEITFAEVKVSKLNPPLGGKMSQVTVILNTNQLA